MLQYKTTRDDSILFSTEALRQAPVCEDGGFYLPEPIPTYEPETMQSLLSRPAEEILSEVLHGLTECAFSGWDLRFALGKAPIRLNNLGSRGILAECWHNPAGRFSEFLADLERTPEGRGVFIPKTFGALSLQTAFVLASIGLARQQGLTTGDAPMNLALAGEDFFAVSAAVLAKRMGAPIERVLCGCLEYDGLWQLLAHGSIPVFGRMEPPAGMELLIAMYAGSGGCCRYLDCVRRGNPYTPDNRTLERMRQDLASSVFSRERPSTLASGAFGSYGIPLSQESALAFGAGQNYSGRKCMVISWMSV